jgi:hypothetical protein
VKFGESGRTQLHDMEDTLLELGDSDLRKRIDFSSEQKISVDNHRVESAIDLQ